MNCVSKSHSPNRTHSAENSLQLPLKGGRCWTSSCGVPPSRCDASVSRAHIHFSLRCGSLTHNNIADNTAAAKLSRRDTRYDTVAQQREVLKIVTRVSLKTCTKQQDDKNDMRFVAEAGALPSVPGCITAKCSKYSFYCLL